MCGTDFVEERCSDDNRDAGYRIDAPAPDFTVALAILLCGATSTFEDAFYASAQNYTALG
jgi:hypothetical protein